MTTDEGSTKSSKLVVFQLIYVSGATVPFTDSDLDELLEKARTYNSTLGITGRATVQRRYLFPGLGRRAASGRRTLRENLSGYSTRQGL